MKERSYSFILFWVTTWHSTNYSVVLLEIFKFHNPQGVQLRNETFHPFELPREIYSIFYSLSSSCIDHINVSNLFWISENCCLLYPWCVLCAISCISFEIMEHNQSYWCLYKWILTHLEFVLYILCIPIWSIVTEYWIVWQWISHKQDGAIRGGNHQAFQNSKNCSTNAKRPRLFCRRLWDRHVKRAI